MTDDAGANAPPSIAALPPTTVRQIGSHQLLTDPSSVVKELIDNALDARAKSIFVDITANTIDSIQVRDDGHGIPSEDRALACRRYCTSKIRDFHDLKEVGGKWLGFRGEALASIADMSGTVSITTRVEGEPVAVKLIYQRNGELTSTERDSHPVGTTVKVTKLLESAKVRKDLAIKGSAKCLAKIRRLIQAHVLARPAVRFRLHVLKAKNNKGDFVYAPKANANVEDAALKIIGKECALQCDWTALEMGSFELHAFLPKPTATGLKVANHGAFISVDSRPVSATRGTLKEIVAAVRDRLRKANPTVANVRDPFFCMNIICPVDSYDPNVEPAKDDVIFGDEDLIVTLVDRLLVSYYPEGVNSIGPIEETESEDAVGIHASQISDIEELLPRSYTPFSVHQDNPFEETKVSSSVAQSQQSRWRSTMYGIDEEDLEFLQENAPVTVEEEEGCRDAAISNPWTIARINAPIRSKKPVSNGQLLSPAKSQGDTYTVPQSPAPAATPRQSKPVEPLTPQASSQTNVHGDRLNKELQQSIQRLPRPASHAAVLDRDPGPRTDRAPELPSFEERMSPSFVQPAPQSSIFDTPIAGTATPRRNPRSRQPFRNKPFVPPALQSDETWFGQPMRNAPKVARPQKRPRQQGPSFFPNDDSSSLQRLRVLPAAERLVETRLASGNNTDIRDFFRKSRRAPADIASSVQPRSSQPQHIADQLRAYAEQEGPERRSPSRPQSADSYQRSTDTAREMNAVFQLHQNASQGPIANPVRRSRLPGITPTSESAPTPRPRRRRTTDGGLHRTKSCTLPLNFIPHGFETHNLSLPLLSSVLSIAQQARKLDMTANSVAWGYDTTDAFDIFGTPMSERKITEWVIAIDSMLHAVFERVDGVEVRGALYEGIQRFLDARKEEEENSVVRAVHNADGQTAVFSGRDDVSRGCDGGVGLPSRGPSSLESGAVLQIKDWSGDVTTHHVKGKNAAVGVAREVDGYEEDFDFSQFVDLDGDAGRRGSPVQIDKSEDGFGDGVDDEMLMDL